LDRGFSILAIPASVRNVRDPPGLLPVEAAVPVIFPLKYPSDSLNIRYRTRLGDGEGR
jgi:hypothetical protein